MNSVLASEFEYYIAHLDDFVSKYDNKFIVLKNKKVLGAYDTIIEAINETRKTEELGTFLVQKCSKDESTYKQYYHSRVRFS